MSVIIKCVPWVALNDLLFPLLQVERCSTFQICIVLDVSWIYSNYSCSHTCMNLDICTHWEELEDWVVGFLIPRRMRINKRMKIHQVSDHNPISILTLIKNDIASSDNQSWYEQVGGMLWSQKSDIYRWHPGGASPEVSIALLLFFT